MAKTAILLLRLISFATCAASFVSPFIPPTKPTTTTTPLPWRSPTAHTTRLHNADTPIPSLYEEQEKLLIHRGEYEATLMSSNKSKPPQGITPNIVKGAGSTGGFGGGGSKGGGSNKKNLKAQAKEHAKVLRQEGVVRIDNVFPPTLADDIREWVYTKRSESEEMVRNNEIQPIERFANVLLKGNRCDMTIPLGESKLVAECLLHIFQNSPVGQTMANLFGKDAVLYELSCLISDPGSDRQNVHPDTPCTAGEEAVLYTCFIALQDITIDMGPTTWIPRSHTPEAHAEFKSDYSGLDGVESKKDVLLRTKPCVLGLLPKGSCGIFDSRLLHCGGANGSEISRALFYVSFKNPKVGYPGNPGSIRKEYISKYTLAVLDKELGKYKKGKESVIY